MRGTLPTCGTSRIPRTTYSRRGTSATWICCGRCSVSMTSTGSSTSRPKAMSTARSGIRSPSRVRTSWARSRCSRRHGNTGTESGRANCSTTSPPTRCTGRWSLPVPREMLRAERAAAGPSARSSSPKRRSTPRTAPTRPRKPRPTTSCGLTTTRTGCRRW